MGYFTTMNLPAPTHEQFMKRMHKYQRNPEKAVYDFELALKDFFEVEGVSTFTNCFTALAFAILHAVTGRVKTVAIAGLSYRRTTDIVLWAGLHPVYVDNSPTTLCMCEKSLLKTLDQMKIGCLLVQHPMVKICDVLRLLEIGEYYKVPIVFDSVEATGSRITAGRIGGFGMAEGFSLHPSKVINAAEGGVLTFGKKEHYQSFRKNLAEIGVLSKSSSKNLSFGLEPVHAMMGLASLEIYPETCAKFKEHYDRYAEKLSNSRMFELVAYDPTNEPNYKSVLVKMRNPEKNSRKHLLLQLELKGIGARAYYSPLHSLTDGHFLPQARQMVNEYFFLPIGHSVNLDDIDFICQQLANFEFNSKDSVYD